MEDINSEISDVFKTDKKGVVLKTDSIGSLEAISKMLNNEGFGVSKKGIGNITKRDVIDAFAMKGIDPNSAVILGFNVGIEKEAEDEARISKVKIINEQIIYKLIDDYKAFVDESNKATISKIEEQVTLPGKIKILSNSCFRVSHPAIFGIEVVEGRIKVGYAVRNEKGEVIGRIQGIQNNKTAMQEATKGMEVAISIDGIMFGRQVKDNDILYTAMNESDFKIIEDKLSGLLSEDEKALMIQISKISKTDQN